MRVSFISGLEDAKLIFYLRSDQTAFPVGQLIQFSTIFPTISDDVPLAILFSLRQKSQGGGNQPHSHTPRRSSCHKMAWYSLG